jgi:putative phage-type endonuclease
MTAAIGDLITPAGRLVLPPDADRAQWLEYRRQRALVIGPWSLGICIGASDVPSILDLDGVDTPAHVYRQKIHGVRREQTQPMRWGHRLEGAIADDWCMSYRSAIDEIGLVSSVERPWLQATIDRRVRECPIEPGLRDGCGLEVKNVGYSSAQRWGRDLPDRILAQVLAQIYVTGYQHMHVACLIGGNDLRPFTVRREREQELLDYIVAEVERFRDEHLIPGVEPDWDTSRKAAKLIELDSLTHPVRAGEIGLDEIDDVLGYAEAAAQESAAKKRKERHLAALRQHADGAEMVLFGDSLAYRFGTQTRRYVKYDALAEKYPDAAADPDVVSETVSHPIYLGPEYKVRRS